ncbi:MAG: hypothetical protein ABJC74_15280 [Gemmatimonadota bacterium]
MKIESTIRQSLPVRRSSDGLARPIIVSGGPAKDRGRRKRDQRPPQGRPNRGSKLVWIVAGCLALLNLAGAPYYLLSRAERVRSPVHPWLKPSGYIGQSAGLLAVAVFLFLWLYPLRKRFRWLAWTGAIARWLDVHVLLALALPLLVAVHASWHFTGVIGLGFWAMMIVWASGVIGRYIYTRIPRGRAGIELSLEEITANRSDLLEEIASRTGLTAEEIEESLALEPPPTRGLGLWGTLKRMVADDLARRKAARALRQRFEQASPRRRGQDREDLQEALRLANREIALTQQVRMLDATHDLFRFWHVAHRPVAVAALAAVVIHVAVVVSLGATWLW